MKSEIVLKSEAIKLLIKNFGVLEAERFINLVKQEKFDYTEW
jgi:hypothetical protein